VEVTALLMALNGPEIRKPAARSTMIARKGGNTRLYRHAGDDFRALRATASSRCPLLGKRGNHARCELFRFPECARKDHHRKRGVRDAEDGIRLLVTGGPHA
jgi:hypothetical protein